ncbi:MAG: helix-turn-helix domain-containing protein [Candidatus Avigastranaerophilus sp.]
MYEAQIKTVKLKFAKHLAKIRKEKGLTKEDFSYLLDVQREHIAKVETAMRNLSFDKLILTSIVLNLPLKDLFDFE